MKQNLPTPRKKTLTTLEIEQQERAAADGC
jgi:hypothetical protein